MDDLITNTVELIRQYQDGNKEVFADIYEATYMLVYSTCYGILHNEDDAKDMTQESFIRIYGSLDKLDEPVTYGKWMKRIASNVSLNFIASMKRKNEYFFEDDSEYEANPGDWTAFDNLPDSFIEQDEKREIINRILKELLSEVQYQTVFLHYFGEMQLSDIAKQMNCPEGTVKTRLKSAKDKFRDALSQYVDENKLVLGAAPFMTRFFNSEMNARKVKIPPIAGLGIPGIGGAAFGTVAAPAAPAAVKAGLLTTLTGKIIAGVLALSVLTASGVFIAGKISKSKDDDPESSVTTSITGSETTTVTTVSRIPVDVFDYVELSYTGKAPFGKAKLKVKDGMPVEGMTFELSKDSGLSNGDTIILTAVGNAEGYELASLTKEYTVEGLRREAYVQDGREISGRDYDLYAPEVIIPGLDMSELNDELYNYCNSVVKVDYKTDRKGKIKVKTSYYDYKYYIGADYVSVMIGRDSDNLGRGRYYEVFNISSETGKLLSKEEFLRTIGQDPNGFNNLVKDSLCKLMSGDGASLFKTYKLNNGKKIDPRKENLEESSIESAVPFVSPDGHLCFNYLLSVDWGVFRYEYISVDTVTGEFSFTCAFGENAGEWDSW